MGMGGNGYEHQLFLAIQALAEIVQRAYWGGAICCYGEWCEQQCRHYKICKATQQLEEVLDTLEEWNC